MIRPCLVWMWIVFVGCSNSLKNYTEIADASVHNGVRLRMGKPVGIFGNDVYSSEKVHLEITNLSSDTIYFANAFVYKDDHPVWGNFEFHISDQDGTVYPLRPATRHYYKIARGHSEHIILPPGASFQDTLSISFELDYNIRKGKTYTIFARYSSQRELETGAFPILLPPGKRLWTGVLQSNTFEFRY